MKNNICKFPSPNASNNLSISCFVLEADKGTMTTRVTLQNDRMILVESGEGTFLFDSIPCTFGTGTLIFGFKGESFALESGDNVSYIYIDFNGARSEALCRRFGIYPHSRKSDNFNGLIPFCRDCLLSTRPENVDITAESVLLYVFSRLSVNHSKQNEIMHKIVEYTQQNFQDSELSLAIIAEKIGYNPKYLSHFFKSNMNISYSEYLRSIRFKYAISLFESGISSVKNVALLSGFSDPLYFSNTFKKVTGISPKAFIEKRAERSDK
jgi:AraC-like DNA-binding protein